LLPIGWSVLIALGGALGTQVWSTASRALWSHTWGIFLLGIIIYLLLAAETGRRCPRPVLLASLLAWTYFVRPSNSIFVIAISVYVFLYYRKSFIPYAFTGAVWLTGFIIYSWHNFGQLLPSYYRANRLRFDAFHVALPGNLISPGRGLLVYVPVLLFIVYLLARYWSERPCPRLVWLALAVVTLNVLAISAFPHWWGGASFGPRLSTETVPWLVLLGIISVKTWMNGREKQRAASSSFRRRAEILAGVSLLALSVFINARGALSFDTWKWNEHPQQVELVQKKLWDWRQPPFLAGIVRPPLDREYPLIETTTRIEFGKKEAGRYLWYGWSSPEETLRWSESKEAALVFALKEIKDVNLRIRLAPFIAKNVHDRQRLTIRLNGQPVHFQVFNDSRDYQVAVMLSRSLLRPQNVVVFELPDAATPASYNLSIDERPLGIAVKWAELEPLDQ
jgi:hypothetical protein